MRVSFKVYKNSPGATVLSIIGTLSLLTGLTVLISVIAFVIEGKSNDILSVIFYSIYSIVLGCFFIYIAKRINTNKVAKQLIKYIEQQGLQQKIATSYEFALYTYSTLPTENILNYISVLNPQFSMKIRENMQKQKNAKPSGQEGLKPNEIFPEPVKEEAAKSKPEETKKKCSKSTAPSGEEYIKLRFKLSDKAKNKEKEDGSDEIRKQYQQIYSNHYYGNKKSAFEFSCFPIVKPLKEPMPWEISKNKPDEMPELPVEFNFNPNSSDVNKGAEAMIAAAKVWANGQYNIMMESRWNQVTLSQVNYYFDQMKEYFETAVKCGNVDAVCAMGWYYTILGSNYYERIERDLDFEKDLDKKFVEKSICKQFRKQYQEMAIPYYKLAARLGHTYALLEVVGYYHLKDEEISNQCISKLEQMIS